MEKGTFKKKFRDLEKSRVLYGNMALTLSIAGLVPFVGFIASPIALYLAIRHWKTPGSITRPGKIRKLAAIILATLGLLLTSLIAVNAFS